MMKTFGDMVPEAAPPPHGTGPDAGTRVVCRIRSGEMQAMGGEGRTFDEREANRLAAIRKRLIDSGFVLHAADAPPVESWVDAGTDAMIYVQVRPGMPT